MGDHAATGCAVADSEEAARRLGFEVRDLVMRDVSFGFPEELTPDTFRALVGFQLE